MAKRKRLKPAAFTRFEPQPKEAALETKADYPLGVAPGAVSRAPIAQVASDTAAHAALEELVDEVDAARSGGRLVLDVALDEIKADHLLRDRMVADPEEMATLKASLQARGQQTPIEVIELEEGGYGLISGWRRLTALQELKAESGEARFETVQALIKPLKGAADSYVAMVEENEVRANLSFYERARLAAEAAKLGIYPSAAHAVSELFAHAPSAKRSKIKSFLHLYAALGDVLRFPTAIPEHLGLALVKALEKDTGLAHRITSAMRKADPVNATAERQVIEQALQAGTTKPPKASEFIPGVALELRKGKVILSGVGVTVALQDALQNWLRMQKG